MGIRKKISLGFVCLALMLTFSGLISVYELVSMSRYTRGLLESNSENMVFSKRMLDAVQEQNTSMLQMIVLGEEQYERSFYDARKQFEKALSEAGASGQQGYDTVRSAWLQHDRLLSGFFNDSVDSDIEWFLGMYANSYHELTAAIKNRMSTSQQMLAADAWNVRTNAYRALTPGIISLGVSVLMVLMFAFLIDFYYTRPIIGINRGLRDFISYKLPFNVKTEGRDEVRTLKESVEELISMCRNHK